MINVVRRCLSYVASTFRAPRQLDIPSVIPAPAPDAEQLLRLLLPTEHQKWNHSAIVTDGQLDLSKIRALLGAIDHQVTPSPFVVHPTRADIAYASTDGIAVSLDRHDAAVAGPVLACGEMEPHVTRLLRRLLSPGAVFVDVGANVGWHSFCARSIVEETGHVFAIEPKPANAMLLADTIERNGLRNVTLLPFAAAATVGYAAFRPAIGSNGGLVDDKRKKDLFSGFFSIVPTFPIDRLNLPRVDVMKIDVEGAEPQVLAGARETLERDHPAIIFEFSCEMTERVGRTQPLAHLQSFQALGYDLALISRPDGNIQPIGDVGCFLAEWGSRFRIEDLLATHPR